MALTQTSFHTSYRSWFSLSLLSSGITEEVAASVFWLYDGTVLRFVVVVFFFKWSRKLCLFSLLSYATDNNCKVSCWISRFIRYMYVCSKLVKYLPFLAVILPLQRSLAHCSKLTKSIVVHLNLVVIVLFNCEISIIPSLSSLGSDRIFARSNSPPSLPL